MAWRVIIVQKGELESTLNHLEADRFEVFSIDFSQPEHDRIVGQQYERPEWDRIIEEDRDD